MLLRMYRNARSIMTTNDWSRIRHGLCHGIKRHQYRQWLQQRRPATHSDHGRFFNLDLVDELVNRLVLIRVMRHNRLDFTD